MTHSAHKPVIGLTGGIGSGKTLVARQLAQLGCGVIDADELASEALEQVQGRLVSRWGDTIVDEAGRMNRAMLAGIVFKDAQELRYLEELTHPFVHTRRQVIRRQLQADKAIGAIVEDCPLLLEKGLESTCDVIIFVYAPWSLRLERLAASRGWSQEDLADREKNQLPLDKKAQCADYTVVNDADADTCFAKVRGIHSLILDSNS